MTCVICFDDIKNPLTLNCKHEYCLECIVTSACVHMNESCPCCREPIGDKMLYNLFVLCDWDLILNNITKNHYNYILISKYQNRNKKYKLGWDFVQRLHDNPMFSDSGLIPIVAIYFNMRFDDSDSSDEDEPEYVPVFDDSDD